MTPARRETRLAALSIILQIVFTRGQPLSCFGKNAVW